MVRCTAGFSPKHRLARGEGGGGGGVKSRQYVVHMYGSRAQADHGYAGMYESSDEMIQGVFQ